MHRLVPARSLAAAGHSTTATVAGVAARPFPSPVLRRSLATVFFESIDCPLVADPTLFPCASPTLGRAPTTLLHRTSHVRAPLQYKVEGDIADFLSPQHSRSLRMITSRVCSTDSMSK